MDLIKFFKELSEKWDKENKCGQCWTFKAPLSESGMNTTIIKDSEKCCVNLFLTSISNNHGYRTSQTTGFKTLEWCDYNFTLYAVKQSNMGINTFNEIPHHPINESLWETILRPIQNCLGCGAELDLCELGYNFDITKWQMETVLLHQDNNYTGWRINGTFRQSRL